jgi:hypothetical protein
LHYEFQVWINGNPGPKFGQDQDLKIEPFPSRVISVAFNPQGLALAEEQNELFVSFENSQISCYDIKSGEKKRQWGKVGTKNGEFDDPCGLAWDEEDGRL